MRESGFWVDEDESGAGKSVGVFEGSTKRTRVKMAPSQQCQLHLVCFVHVFGL